MSQTAESSSNKAGSALAQVAGVGMAFLGSSTAGSVLGVQAEQVHADHGHSAARWAGAVISTIGFLIGGIAFPFDLWSVVILGGVLQIVALLVTVVMNATGYGRPDVWGELKAKAAAERGQ
jgi:hypothetical protein